MSRSGTRALGSGLALMSAFTFAANVVFVSVMYDHGGNIHAVNLVRPLFFVGCVALWIVIRRTSIRLPSRQRYACAVLGLLFCVEFYGVHAAIRYIPVGLAILIVYTYPLMVALTASIMHRKAPSVPLLAAMIIVFGGLALALYTPAQGVEWRGIGGRARHVRVGYDQRTDDGESEQRSGDVAHHARRVRHHEYHGRRQRPGAVAGGQGWDACTGICYRPLRGGNLLVVHGGKLDWAGGLRGNRQHRPRLGRLARILAARGKP